MREYCAEMIDLIARMRGLTNQNNPFPLRVLRASLLSKDLQVQSLEMWLNSTLRKQVRQVSAFFHFLEYIYGLV